MWIASKPELLAGLILSVLLIGPIYYTLSRVICEINTRERVIGFSAIWLAAATIEFYALGPFSFVELTSEGNLGMAFYTYFASHKEGMRISLDFGGGHDPYVMFAGMQYIQPDVFLLNFLPPWIVLLLHKLSIGILGLWGAYLLARDCGAKTAGQAIAAAAMFPFAHLYLLNFSTEFGTGFAVIPLAIHLCFADRPVRLAILRILTAAALLALAQPMKVVPAFLAAMIGALFLIRHATVPRLCLSVACVAVLSFLNWHEIIWALKEMGPLTSRGFGADSDQHSLLDGITTGLQHSLLFGYASAAFLAAILILAIQRHSMAWRTAGAFASLPVLFTIAYAVPWHEVGLAIVNRMEHRYMLLAIPTLMVGAVATALASLPSQMMIHRIVVYPATFVLAIAISTLFWNKYLNVAQYAWFGGQAQFENFSTLKNPAWKAGDYRTVTALETPNANITTAFYGLESFDAQLNLAPKFWADYWQGILRWAPDSENLTRLSLRRAYWNGTVYDFDAQARTDLLAIANVRYVVSSHPLKSAGLQKILAPKKERAPAWRPADFPNFFQFARYRLARLVDPGDHFVYELKGVLPKIFGASQIISVPNDTSVQSFQATIAEHAPARAVVVFERDAGTLGSVGDVSVLNYERSTNGFNAEISAPTGGVLVFNVLPYPYWLATVDGEPVSPVPANQIHLAVPVTQGARNVVISYQRPLLRDIVSGLWRP